MDRMPLDRCCGQLAKLDLDCACIEAVCSVQASQGRQDLGIDVRRCVQGVTSDATPHCATKLVVQQKIDQSGCVDDGLSHAASVLRPLRRRAPPGRDHGTLAQWGS